MCEPVADFGALNHVLNDLKKKKDQLLVVLNRPNTSLHNNDSERDMAITLQTVPPISLHTVPVISLQTVPLSIMNNIVLALLKKQYQHGRKQKKHYGYQTSITTQTKRI